MTRARSTFLLSAFCSLLFLAGCSTPSKTRYPAGDGKLLDTNGVPVHVQSAK
jgi:hypothetical protein